MNPLARALPLALLLTVASSPARATEDFMPTAGSLAELKLAETIELEGQTHHVQGIAVQERRLWLSSVERETKKGRIHLFSLASGAESKSAEVQEGELYHPGGIALEEGALWVPVAVYTRAGESLIQARDPETLALQSQFRVADHIGCVAVHGEEVIGGNWDARRIYFWKKSGELLRSVENSLPTRYQDLKVRGGMLVASGNLPGRAGGAIDFLVLPSLARVHSLAAGKTSRGVNYTHEGMDLAAGRLYLLPEDAPSRLFIFAWGE